MKNRQYVGMQDEASVEFFGYLYDEARDEYYFEIDDDECYEDCNDGGDWGNTPDNVKAALGLL